MAAPIMMLLLIALGGMGAMPAWASAGPALPLADLATPWLGPVVLAIFFVAYVLVIAEERLRLPKSQPLLLAAGLIWAMIGWVATQQQLGAAAEAAVRHNLLEFCELFLFLIAAMTFINTMGERGVFDALRGWLVGRRFSLRQIFWITGALAFVISPFADNLTTALMMGAVVMAVAADRPPFVALACINIVVAANAGGAFSPFGDITTLMVWQSGKLAFGGFFALLVPALVNWLVPAQLIAWQVPKEVPPPISEMPVVKPGGMVVVGLFLFTIALTTGLHQFSTMPPAMGMMSGLGVLKMYSYFLRRRIDGLFAGVDEPDNVFAAPEPMDTFRQMEKAEWDTLMFFFGVILCVGGVGTLGYLALASQYLYGSLGATTANVLVGLVSAVVDNIPVMFAVLTMNPDMSTGQWLLVTLTAGVGGSLLSIGSAAGVALMGQARGIYTFGAHLRWLWAIALGYGASIVTHFLVNGHLF